MGEPKPVAPDLDCMDEVVREAVIPARDVAGVMAAALFSRAYNFL